MAEVILMIAFVHNAQVLAEVKLTNYEEHAPKHTNVGSCPAGFVLEKFSHLVIPVTTPQNRGVPLGFPLKKQPKERLPPKKWTHTQKIALRLP